MIKPKKLSKGDLIGVISPSSPVAGLALHRMENGVKALQNLGFRVVVGKNALKVTGYTAGSIEERVSDIHEMFLNTEVKAVIAFIGGFHSNQLLKHINFDIIKNNPKIFMGFSDNSVLHFAFHTKGNLNTFYGPMVLTQFGEPFGIDSYTKEYFEKALLNVAPIGNILASEQWTDEMLNWFQQKDLERPKIMSKNDGYIWLKGGNATGKILGGCITAILHLRGTEYWPSFKDCIFFWESPESSCDFSKGESPARIDAHLTDLRLSGVFDQINGMIIGRPKSYNDEDMEKLKTIILNNTKGYNFPILFNINIGHTDPIITLPIGVQAKLDSDNNLFEILESAVQ